MRSMSERRRPSPAMIVAIVALSVALAGTAMAGVATISKISGKTVKKNSLPGNRIKTDTVTGKQVKESMLGTVPSAAHADTATHATSADNAGPRAYGEITKTTPFFVASGSKNIASVTNPSTGVYCVAFTASVGIDTTETGATTSADFANDDTLTGPPASSDTVTFAEWNSDPSVCPAGEMAFRTGYQQAGSTAEGNTDLNEPFFFVVP